MFDLGYNTGQFSKNHLGDHTASLPTAHGFQEYWGYLYHLDAMQAVSFPDIYKYANTAQGFVPACQDHARSPAFPRFAGRHLRRKTTVCMAAATPDYLDANPPTARRRISWCRDQGRLTLDRSKTIDEEISAQSRSIAWTAMTPRKTGKPFFC